MWGWIPVTWTQSSATTWTLSNGLLARTFQTQGGFATVGFMSLVDNTSILRVVGAEAKVTLDDTTYNLGDLVQPEPKIFLNLTSVVRNTSAWRLKTMVTSKPVAPYHGPQVRVTAPPRHSGRHQAYRVCPSGATKLSPFTPQHHSVRSLRNVRKHTAPQKVGHCERQSRTAWVGCREWRCGGASWRDAAVCTVPDLRR